MSQREDVDTALPVGYKALAVRSAPAWRSSREASNSQLIRRQWPIGRSAGRLAGHSLAIHVKRRRPSENKPIIFRVKRDGRALFSVYPKAPNPAPRRPIGQSGERASELNELDDTRAQYQLSGADIARSHTSIALARDGQLKGIIIGADLKPHWTAAMAMAMAVAETAHKQHHASISLASRSW